MTRLGSTAALQFLKNIHCTINNLLHYLYNQQSGDDIVSLTWLMKILTHARKISPHTAC